MDASSSFCKITKITRREFLNTLHLLNEVRKPALHNLSHKCTGEVQCYVAELQEPGKTYIALADGWIDSCHICNPDMSLFAHASWNGRLCKRCRLPAAAWCGCKQTCTDYQKLDLLNIPVCHACAPGPFQESWRRARSDTQSFIGGHDVGNPLCLCNPAMGIGRTMRHMDICERETER